jgi:hypothetical protein
MQDPGRAFDGAPNIAPEADRCLAVVLVDLDCLCGTQAFPPTQSVALSFACDLTDAADLLDEQGPPRACGYTGTTSCA